MLTNVLPLEWCASPKGCYGDTNGNPATSPTEQSDSPVTILIQETVDSSIDSFMNGAVWSLVKVAIFIVAIFIVIAIVKKLIGVFTHKMKELNREYEAGQHKTAAYISAALSPEVLQADQQRREKYKARIEQEDVSNGLASFQSQMLDSRNDYLSEIAKQDSTRDNLTESLKIPDEFLNSNISDVAEVAKDFAETQQWDSETFEVQAPEQLFEKYNRELIDTSYDNMEATASNAARSLGVSDENVEKAKRAARVAKDKALVNAQRKAKEALNSHLPEDSKQRALIEEELRRIASGYGSAK